MSRIYISTRLGYPLPPVENARNIRNAGFDGVLLWMGDEDGLPPQERIRAYIDAGLVVENLHAPVRGANEFWVSGNAGEETLRRFFACMEMCERFGIEVLVIHMTRGTAPIPVDAAGAARLWSLIRCAEEKGVRLAFENVRQLGVMKEVLDRFSHSETVGLCFDCGHNLCWNHGVDWLGEYRNRIFAVHLSDNDGVQDQHLMPFDGILDWTKTMADISQSGYQDKICLEVKYDTSVMYEGFTMEEFLSTAYVRAKDLERFIIVTELEKQQENRHKNRCRYLPLSQVCLLC